MVWARDSKKSGGRVRVPRRLISLRWKGLILVSVIMALEVGYLTLFWLPRTRMLEEVQTVTRVTDHCRTVGESITPLLLQRQYGAIHETLDALTARQVSWNNLTLVRSDGLVLYPLGGAEPGPDTGRQRVRHPIMSRGHEVAALVLDLDLDVETAASRHQNSRMVTAISLVTLLVLLALALFVDFLVIRPVRGLHRAADRMASGDNQAALPFAGDDEVGGLVRAFAGMRREIEHRQEELEKARVKALAASEAKSQFLASMSHEIRTPMNGIIAVADLMQEEELGPDQREYLGTISSSAEHLLTILNDILDFSKIEAGMLELSPKPFRPAALLDDLKSLMSPLAETRDVRFAVDHTVDQDLGLSADVDRLRQVLINLCNNAIKFTPGGHVTVKGHVGDLEGSRCTLHLAVEDTGIGMDQEVIDRLFTRFMQADAGSSRKYGGTGLGLAICKQIVDLMGGEIGATSVPGAGSRFWLNVSLPLCEPGALDAERPPVPEGGNESHQLDVLVAEDNPTNQLIARRVLEKAGHRVIMVENGQLCLECLGEGSFDLVLMDMQMPVMDGIEATRIIRGKPQEYGDLPILALTANASTEASEECRAAGCSGFLTKPLKPRELLAAIDEAMAGRQVQPG